MKPFLKRILYFTLPCWIYLLIILVIDPYNYSGKSHRIDNTLKEEISYKLHNPLWRLIKYNHEPTPNILLGDSRTNLLKEEDIKRISGQEFTSMGYGAASITEITETFWTIVEHHELKNVYVGINFNLYNKLNNRNRVVEAKSIKENFISYTFSRYSFDAMLLILKAIILNEVPEIENPNMGKQEFWDYQLEVGGKNYYSTYKYPENYYQQLKEVSAYCASNNINLVFIIHPTHIDLQKKVGEYGLQGEEMKFRNELKSLGTVYDFDFESELTNNKEEYLDPFHYDREISKIVINEVFNKKMKYSRVSFVEE